MHRSDAIRLPHHPAPDVSQRMGADRRGSGFVVQLHNGVESIIPEATRAALLRVIPLTTIELPTDPFDPTGKHSRRIFPDHLTRDQVIDLLREVESDA